jgi:6-pyruvoyltetrahydropterin/6-carboxytetrahydropterin synthase
MFELTTIVDFEAAHCIKGYPGKCSRLHGHNWKVEVTVSGQELDNLGMLIDFKVLKQDVNKVIETLDHYYLNETDYFCTVNPTAENIAKYIYHQLVDSIGSSRGVLVKMVKVWESPHSAAVYQEE